MFEELGGQYIAETSVIGETWFMIKGRKRGDWRKIDIDYILNLSEWEKQ
jgi:hypothetical protein